MDEELERLKQQKMRELLQERQQAEVLDKRREDFEAQKSAVLRQLLTPEARERLARLKMAHPDVVGMVEQQLIGLAQTGRLNKMIDDETLKGLLERLMPQKRDIKIERR